MTWDHEPTAVDGARRAPSLSRGDPVGRYIVLDELGRDERGPIFSAYDSVLDRRVALRVIAGADAGEGELLEAARAAARVTHPHVVAVHDAAPYFDGLYVVTDLSEGQPFDAWLAARPRSWRAVAQAVAGAARGLAAAHEVGVTHGSLRAAGIIVDDEGVARVRAFGLGRRRGSARDDVRALAGMAAPGAPRRLRRVLERGAAGRSAAELARDVEAMLAGSRRRGAIAALAVGAAAVALLWPAPSRSPCAAAGVLGVWDEARRGRVAAALERSDAPYAAAAARGATAALDAHAAAWRAMGIEVCEATRVRGEQPEELHDARMACLGERRAELDALAAELERGGRAVLENAVAAAASLPPVAACASTRGLRELARPADPAWVATLDGQLAAALGAFATGNVRGAAALASAVREAARPLGYRPLEARAALLSGLVHHKASEPQAAERDLIDGIVAAEAGHDDRDVAVGWARLARLRAAVSRRLPEAQHAADLAAAAVGRLGGDAAVEAEIAEARALVAFSENRPADALAGYRRALSLLGGARPENPLDVARVLNDLSGVHYQLGDLGETERALREALRLTEEAVGPAHPEVAYLRMNLGSVARDRGDLEAAETATRRALEILEQALGRGPASAVAQANLGMIVSERGRHDEAIELLRGALALQEARHAPLGATLAPLASALIEAGRLDEARAAGERGLALSEAGFGPASPEAARLHRVLSRVHRLRGDLERALRDAEAALAADEKSGGRQVGRDLLLRGEVYLLMGRAADADVDFARALEVWTGSGGVAAELALPLAARARAQLLLGDRARAAALVERAAGLEGLAADREATAAVEEARRALAR